MWSWPFWYFGLLELGSLPWVALGVGMLFLIPRVQLEVLEYLEVRLSLLMRALVTGARILEVLVYLGCLPRFLGLLFPVEFLGFAVDFLGLVLIESSREEVRASGFGSLLV